MKETPLLFNAPMVRATRADLKTETRRIVKPQPSTRYYNIEGTDQWAPVDPYDQNAPDVSRIIRCPYGKEGDRLWGRETWACDEYGRRHKSQGMVYYRADAESMGAWRPSIHMPRWASRITLEIVYIEFERLHHMGELSAKAEGVIPKPVVSVDRGVSYLSYCEAFADLWDGIYGASRYSWESNPWVWVITFKQEAPHATT